MTAFKEEHESINCYKIGTPQFKDGRNDVGNPLKVFLLHNSCEDKAYEEHEGKLVIELAV